MGIAIVIGFFAYLAISIPLGFAIAAYMGIGKDER